MHGTYPDFLYHYTSLETLALILEGRKIKFSLLSTLNDPLEGKNKDFQKAESLIYSSSWTANPDDTIPMWNLYSGMTGVRIKLPSEMFSTKSPIATVRWLGSRCVPSANLSAPPSAQLETLKNVQSNNILLETVLGPERVRYVDRDKVDDIEPVLFSTSNGDDGLQILNLSHVGLQKSDDWEFEQEWRFRLPFRALSSPNAALLSALSFKAPFVLVNLKPQIFDQMEVTLGPKSDHSAAIILQSVLDKFAPKARWKRSAINIR